MSAIGNNRWVIRDTVAICSWLSVFMFFGAYAVRPAAALVGNDVWLVQDLTVEERFVKDHHGALKGRGDDPIFSRYSAADWVRIVSDYTANPEAKPATYRPALKLVVPSELATVELIAKLGDFAPEVEKWLIVLVAKHAGNMARLLEITGAGSPRQKAAALRALVLFGARAEIVDSFVSLLDDPSDEVRYWAAFCLGRFDSQAAAQLVSALAHDDIVVRAVAAEAIGFALAPHGSGMMGDDVAIADEVLAHQEYLVDALGESLEAARDFGSMIVYKVSLYIRLRRVAGTWSDESIAVFREFDQAANPVAGFWIRQAIDIIDAPPHKVLHDLHALLQKRGTVPVDGFDATQVRDKLLPMVREDKKWSPREGADGFSVQWPEGPNEDFVAACEVVRLGFAQVASESSELVVHGEPVATVLERIINRHIGLLIRALEDELGVGLRAARELVELYPASKAHLRREFLRYPRFPVGEVTYHELVWVLEQMGVEALDVLTLGLQHWQQRVPLYAAQAIGKIGTSAEPAIPFLISTWRCGGYPIGSDLWDDPSEKSDWSGRHVFRGLDGKTFADIGPVAVPHLVRALRDRHAVVRRRSCVALGAIGGEAAVVAEELSELLGDQEVSVRLAAARALLSGVAGERKDLERLAQAILSSDAR